MQFRSATKVGLAVLMSFAAFVGIWYFLNRQTFRSNTYPLQVSFPDAQNITPGAAVRMAGVEVGVVREIGLTKDNQALLDLRIFRRYEIPKDSRFTVTSGGLIGEKYVSINPRVGEAAAIPAGARVQGQGTVQIEDLMATASQLASSADQVIQESRLALMDTRRAINELSRYVQDPRLKESLLVSMRNAEVASRNIVRATETADRTAQEFRSIAAEARPTMRRTLASVEQSTGNIAELTGAINEIVAGEDIKSGLGATVNNLRLSSEQLPLITQRMANITANIEKLSADPAYATELRETFTNLRVATSEARESAEAINETVQRLTGRFRRNRPDGGTPTSTPPDPRAVPLHGTVDLVQNLDPGRFHADVNAVVPFGQKSFVRGGIYGLGEENRLNFQIGEAFSEEWSARYGLYKGWLGLGLDQNFGRESGWSFDLYHPNRPSLDVYARRRLQKDTSIVVGVESLFQNPTPSIGIRIRR